MFDAAQRGQNKRVRTSSVWTRIKSWKNGIVNSEIAIRAKCRVNFLENQSKSYDVPAFYLSEDHGLSKKNRETWW